MTKSRFAVLIITKKAFNRFLAVTKETSTGEIIFSIVSLIGKSNKFEDIYYKIGDKLREYENLVKQALDDQKQMIVEVLKERKTVKSNEESAISPNFFQDNNAIKPYTAPMIK